MNMKKMKKVMALLLSVIMILAMSATVFAAQTKITITGGVMVLSTVHIVY